MFEMNREFIEVYLEFQGKGKGQRKVQRQSVCLVKDIKPSEYDESILLAKCAETVKLYKDVNIDTVIFRLTNYDIGRENGFIVKTTDLFSNTKRFKIEVKNV